jgi:hypothetical protein
MPEVLSAKPPNHGSRLNHWTWIRTLWCFPKFQIAGTRLFDLISIYEAVYYIMYSFFLNRYCCTYSKVLCIYIYILQYVLPSDRESSGEGGSSGAGRGGEAAMIGWIQIPRTFWAQRSDSPGIYIYTWGFNLTFRSYRTVGTTIYIYCS